MMRKEETKVYLVVQSNPFSDNEHLQLALADWVTLSQILTKPNGYTIDEEPRMHVFDKKKLKQQLSELTNDTQAEKLITLLADTGECSIQLENGRLKQSLLIDLAVFQAHQSIIEDYINQKMIENGSFAYIRDSQEYLAHNMQSFAEREAEQVDFPTFLPKMYDDQQQIIVDCSQLNGYDFYFHHLCFTSCWKMWFSSSYYHVIPKKAFIDVQQVDDVTELANEVVQITLFKELTAWQHPQNLGFQLMFRNQLGFDQLEWGNGVGVLREPWAEFMRLGKNTQMIQYQNSSLQPTKKSLARHFTTRVYNYETTQYLEGRRYGRLNNRAYYPWQDASKKTMLAYWVLNPVYMIDEGVAAFEFYINQYLNLQIVDEQTKDYQAVLRFYVPQTLIPTLPLEHLQAKLQTKNVEIKRKKSKSRLLKIETTDGELQVEFVDVEELGDPQDFLETDHDLNKNDQREKNMFKKK